VTRAVSRSLSVLELLAEADEPLELPEIIERTGIARASAQRLMNSLTEDGYVVRRGDPPAFSVSFRLCALASAILSSIDVRTVALPNLIQLATSVQSPVTLAFLEDTDVCYTDRVEVVGDRVIPALISDRIPAVGTGSGRVLIAWRPETEWGKFVEGVEARTGHTTTSADQLRAELRLTRERGYSPVDREYYPDASGVAAPVFDREGQVIAAISVPVWGALSEDAVQRLIPPLLAAARRTSIELGYRVAGELRIA
jgi:IclR family transcriptional regulator, pca regulon regulatory protein